MRLYSSAMISRFIVVAAAILAGAAGGWSLATCVIAPWLATAALEVETAPAGAAVFVDGDYRGLSPLTLRLARGRHLLHFIAAGYQDARQAVNLAQNRKLSTALSPLPVGNLTVASAPKGAAVFIDGKLRGRTPLCLSLPLGRHTLEIAAPNYITEAREVEIAAGCAESIEVEMNHRQVAFYRQRLQHDPGDLAAYNDLGELLFVLGRYEDAARLFAEGLWAAGQYANRSAANRKNAEKMRNEARNKHRDPAGRFSAAFDREVLEMIKTGKVSPFLFAEFQRIPQQRYGEEYLAAYRGLVQANPQNPEFLLAWLEFARSRGLHDDLRAGVESFLAAPPTRDFGVHLQLIRILRTVAETSLSERRDLYLDLLARVIAAARALARPAALAADFHYEESVLGRMQGDAAAEREALTKAIACQRNTTVANAWRLQLVALWRKAGDNARAKAHCEEILKSKAANDPAVARAKAIIEEIAREEQGGKKPKANGATPNAS